ncbi:hypothetical protein EIP91_004626 [Steccherinum ochraceum]|uniref:Transforming growth factor beta regulator 1 n=1 Tax=Steccherinum ochraceum TaxID=92696 RepID=A0A4R0RQV7_9APHY|nr:hypothetical protein EIP91_004626 [Steccherinum ochraceum]
MSRSARPHQQQQSMAPPPNDVLMGPPPLPLQAGAYNNPPNNSARTNNKESQDVSEKYRRLKKRFFELEERHKDAVLELRRSGERTVAWNHERAALLERIDELSTNQLNPERAIPSPSLTAYPRSLLSGRSQREFLRNLDMGVMEAENEPLDLDPLQMSRHVGPQARRMQEAEERERQEEEAKEARRATKRPRVGLRTKDSLPPPTVSGAPPPPQHHHTPQPYHAQHLNLHNHPSPQMMIPMPQGPPLLSPGQAPMNSPPVLMSSNSGSRLRAKPPAPLSPSEISPAPSTGSAPGHSTPLSPPPHSAPLPQGRSATPPSPLQGQEDEYMRGPSPPPATVAPSSALAPGQVPPPPSTPAHAPAPLQMPQPATPPATELGSTPGPGHALASPALSPPSSNGGIVTLSPAHQYRQTPVDPAKAAQSQMQMTLRPSSGTGGPGRPSEMQRHTKPKRLKAHTVTTKSFSIPVVPRGKDGLPMLPLNVGIMTVLNLGTIGMREHFHTERYIFPIGYEVTRYVSFYFCIAVRFCNSLSWGCRRYLSTVDPHSEVVYNCKIMDGGDGPKFQIIAADVPEAPFTAGTATGAWSVVVRSANMIRNRQHSNSVSGPDFFGLGQNTIKHLIQELPGADMLKDYVWQKFVEGGPLGGRHAAVIPALPEDHENNIMYAPIAPAMIFDHSPPPPPTPPIANNGNGAPSHYYSEQGELVELDNTRELQIIHVDTDDLQSGTNHAHDGRVKHRSMHALSQGAPMTMTSTLKPILFHQEYPTHHPRPVSASPLSQAAQTDERIPRQVVHMPMPESESPSTSTSGVGRRRQRRDSRASNASYDGYTNGSTEQARSPASVSSSSHRERERDRERDRPHSRSPLLHREQSAAYSPSRRGSAHSPYLQTNGAHRDGEEREYLSPTGSSGSHGQATFSSVMSAYPAQPPYEKERSRESERDRNGGDRMSPEYTYANAR